MPFVCASRLLFLVIPESLSTRSLSPRFHPAYSRGFSRERFPCTIRYLTHFGFFLFIRPPFSLASSERSRLISNERRRSFRDSDAQVLLSHFRANSDKFFASHRRIAVLTSLPFSLFLPPSPSLLFLFFSHPLCSLLRINLIDDVRNFSSLYFGARKSPVVHSAIHRIPCLFILSSLFHEIEFDIYERFHAITERAYRST